MLKQITIIATLLFLATPGLKSCQQPEKQTETLKIKLPGVELHAVKTTPAGTKKAPIAIFIAGSGPTDLDGNQPGMKNNSLKLLSDGLVENGIATLRFDKRGIAKSAYADFKEDDLTIDQYATDVQSIIRYLKENGHQSIYIIGHSEGSLIGLIALQHEKADGFVSIAGAGNSADQILKTQLKPKLPHEQFEMVAQFIDSLANGNKVTSAPPELGMLFRASVQPYLISWFRYNPAELIKKIDCKALVVQGEKDIQVSMDDARLLANATEKATLVKMEGMNHVLKTIDGEMQQNIQSYSNPDLPLHKGIVEKITTFIKNN
jgi:alpha/beta superfamily hydrolase